MMRIFRHKKLLILILILCIIFLFIPVKKAVNISDKSDGYILKIQQTTGPVWKVSKILGTNMLDLSLDEEVILVGNDPYSKLSLDLISTGENDFWFLLSYEGEYTSSTLQETYKILRVKQWDICYPIKNAKISDRYLINLDFLFNKRKLQNDY